MKYTALSDTSPKAVSYLFSHLHTGVDAEHNIRKLLFQLCPKLCHRGVLPAIRMALELMRLPKMNLATESSRFMMTPAAPYRMMVLFRKSIVVIPQT